MTTPYPMWSAIKRGMLLGAIAGLNLAFLLIMQNLSSVVSPYPYPVYPPTLGNIFADVVIGGGIGLGFGAFLGVIWSWLRRPQSRIEADLKAAAALRSKELINDADYQALKASILGSYRADSSVGRRIMSSAFWGSISGATIALGGLASNVPLEGYPSGTSLILIYVLPLVIVGTGLGTAIAAIIQSALQSKTTSQTPKHAMLGAPQFDPLDSIRTSEVQPVKATSNR